jgi:methylmalonyl-CoA mutase N-terminal domain/subunit
VAKLRAARRMWWRIATERYGACNPNSARLRFFSGCSGAVLSAQEPRNNIIRSTIQCLAAVIGGAQSIHVMGYDEALGLPAEESVRLAVRTQQIVAHESGAPQVIDPLAGSYYVEHLTDELERRAFALMDEIDGMGGVVEAITQGRLQRLVAEKSYAEAEAIRTGDKPKVGVNLHADPGVTSPSGERELFQVERSAREVLIARLHATKAQRSAATVASALASVREAAASDANLMPPILAAVKARATVGEISDALRDVFGEYEEVRAW